MSARILRYLSIFVLSYVYVGISVAQSPAAHARFAIEIPSFNGPLPYYVTIPEAVSPSASPCTTFSYDHSLERLANAGAGVEQPSTLQLEICVKGDTLLFTPTVYYGDAGRQSPPASEEKLPSQTLATHSGKLNDIVSFPEMEQVGLEALTLHIVSAQSDFPYHPLTRSDVPSVQIECAPVDRTSCTLTLHNLSNKAVDGVRIGSSEEKNSGSGMEVVKGGLPAVIAPNSSYQMTAGVPHSGKTVDGTFVEDPKPEYMILQTVLFADGSYEGEERYAAEMAAREFGTDVQLSHIKRLAEPILANDSLDDESKIERIRAAIQQLSTNPDSDTIAQFHTQFPAISEGALTKAESSVAQAMKSENEAMDHLIQENEPIIQQNQTRLTLARWWTAMTEGH